MNKEFRIVIPSHKRAEHLLSHKGCNTLRYMGQNTAIQDNTLITVREEEEEDYIPVANKYGCGILYLYLNETDGIVETRDRILEEAHEQEIEYLIMIDDDLKFATRDLENKYTRYDEEGNAFAAMVKDLLFHCNHELPLVGITARQFSNDKPATTMNTRVIQLFCMHVPTIRASGILFGDIGMRYMTDYYFVISLLQLGYPNMTLNTYTRDDIAQAPGGCAVRRTVELYNDSAKRLKRKFPDFVRLEWKTGGTWKEPRITPYVSWQKAYAG